MSLTDPVEVTESTRCTSLLKTRYVQLRVLLSFSLIDSLSSWLLILLYLTGKNLVWLVNLNFALMSFMLLRFSSQSRRDSPLTVFFYTLLLLSFVKLASFFDSGSAFQFKHCLSYFYGLLIPLLALSFTSKFSSADAPSVFEALNWYARRYLFIALPGILSYSLLYFTGNISYFGLGTNLYYVIPFFLFKGGLLKPLLLFGVVLLTGKRAFLVTFLSEILFSMLSFFRRSKLYPVLTCALLFSILFWMYNNTELLSRFKWIFESNFNFDDPYFLAVSAGGRFEEVFGIYNYFTENPLDLLFGSPPGSYFFWNVELSDYVTTKNYSHITWVGYVFRYGLTFTVPLFLYFLYLVLRNLGSSNPLYISFIGIFVGSFFGASLIIDPTAWILLGLFISLCTSFHARKS